MTNGMPQGSRHYTSILSLAALLSLALPLADTAAQQQGGADVYVDLGTWTIYSDSAPRTCALVRAPSNGARLIATKTGAGTMALTLETARPLRPASETVFAFDDAEFEARPAGNRALTPVIPSSAIENAFRQARILSVRQDGATLATISLSGSSAGFRLLKQCAEQGRLGASLPPAPRQAAREVARAPEPALPPPAASSPPPRPAPSLASPPSPINASNWVRANDRIRPPRNGGGTLQFTLVVDPRGRAEECVVDRSTGSAGLDEQLCRLLLRRARFEPASDPSGNPTEGRFSSSVRYVVPD